MSSASITLQTLVETMDLKNLTPEIDLSQRRITVPETNRTA